MGPLSAAVAELCRRVGVADAVGTVDGLCGPFRLAVFGGSVAGRKGCAAALAELLDDADWEITESEAGGRPRYGVHGAVAVLPAEPASALATVRGVRLAVPDVTPAGVLAVLAAPGLELAAERPLRPLVGGLLRPGDPAGLGVAVHTVFDAHRDELAAAAALTALRRAALHAPPAGCAALLDGIDELLDGPVAQPLRLLPAIAALRTGAVWLPPGPAAEVKALALFGGGPLPPTELARVGRRERWWRELADSAVAPQVARVAQDVALGYRLAAADATAAVAASEADLRARRDTLLTTRRDAVRGWQPRLRTEIAKVRLSLGVRLNGLLGQLQREVRAHVEAAGAAGRRQVPELAAGALRTVAADLTARLTAAAAELHTLLGELVGPGAGRPPEVPALEPPAPAEPPSERLRGEDRLLLLTGASGGIGLARLAVLPVVGLPALLGTAWVPLSVGLAAGAAAWLFRTNRTAGERARLHRWLAETLAQARALLDAGLAERLIDVEHRLSVATSAVAERRLAAIERELLELDQQLRRPDPEHISSRRGSDESR